MVNYQNGKIYKIESLIGNCRYIGSTCQKLSMRMAKHRQKYRQQKQYYTSYEVLKYSDAKILLILNHACNSKEELEAKEAEYIKQLDCVNKYIPQRTEKQYREDNKELIAEKQRKWRSENKEYTKEYNKKYQKKYRKIKYTCECGSTISKAHKTTHNKTKKHLKFIEQQ